MITAGQLPFREMRGKKMKINTHKTPPRYFSRERARHCEADDPNFEVRRQTTSAATAPTALFGSRKVPRYIMLATGRLYRCGSAYEHIDVLLHNTLGQNANRCNFCDVLLKLELLFYFHK